MSDDRTRLIKFAEYLATYDTEDYVVREAAVIIRENADRIAELEAQLAEYKNAECRAVKCEGAALRQLDAVRNLHAFEVPHAPVGAKAVWVSDLNAALQGESDDS